jgi:molecular chaperone DnaJ
VPRVRCETCGGKGRVRTRVEQDHLDLLQLETCTDCGGSGRTSGADCGDCDGSGRITLERELRLIVPAGVRDGDRLRVQDVDGHVGVKVLPKPAERRAVRYLAAVALVAAIALLVYVLVS